MNRVIISTFLSINIVSAINPPQTGTFPDGFWEKLPDFCLKTPDMSPQNRSFFVFCYLFQKIGRF